MLQSELGFVQKKSFLTVTELTAQVKNLLEGRIGEVWVRGELSGFKPATSGHLYFSLKDGNSVINCAFFRSQNYKMKFVLKDGLDVLIHGKISVYPPRGNYQLIVDVLEPMGDGALQLAFEQLKIKLQSEGLFDQSRKRPIPKHPKKIVIITSPTGAAIQDILSVLHRRQQSMDVLVIPTLVQGDEACAQIVRAIEIANKNRLGEVLIVSRGGGSVEDLWCFNEEEVVRAIANSSIPVISAVGHEVDFTLSDFASDLRAPTPSAAAEMVCLSHQELCENLDSVSRRISFLALHKVSKSKNQLLTLEKRLVSPSEKLAQYRQMLDELFSRMSHGIQMDFQSYRHRLSLLAEKCDTLSPLKVLGRGYTLVRDPGTGSLVKSVTQVKNGQRVKLVFQDGSAQAEIQNSDFH